MPRVLTRAFSIVALSATLCASASAQNCGWSHIDHVVNYDASGIWNSTAYRSVLVGASLVQIGGAVWEGAESRLGKTTWQGVDSEIMSGLTAEAGKFVFTRVRPREQHNPCLWFQGGSNYSFPSEEASLAAGLVTPYMLDYGSEHAAVYLLALLPMYVGAGRIKNQAHWQTDVLAGWAIGGVSGWYAHEREVPLMITLLPHGVAIGLHKQF